MEASTRGLPQPTLLQEFRGTALLFGIAIGTTGGTVLATRLLLHLLG